MEIEVALKELPYFLERFVLLKVYASIRADELALLTDVAAVMRDASICGLGQTAASAIQSAIATFGLFDAEATA